jgi:hypothetical protein
LMDVKWRRAPTSGKKRKWVSLGNKWTLCQDNPLYLVFSCLSQNRYCLANIAHTKQTLSSANVILSRRQCSVPQVVCAFARSWYETLQQT